MKSNVISSYAGLALGAAALAVTLMRPAPKATPQPSDIEARIAALEQAAVAPKAATGQADRDRAYRSMSRRLAKLEAGRALAKADVQAERANGQADEPLKDDVVRYEAFEVPNAAIVVKQAEDGSLSVTNTDASLDFKRLAVDAKRADGTVDKLTVVVPKAGS